MGINPTGASLMVTSGRFATVRAASFNFCRIDTGVFAGATSAKNVLFFTTILTAFAVTIAIGVVYNNARIQLAERSWELASLRVLGFTRGEVSVLLLGELALEIALAIPLGFVAGFWLSALIVALMTHDVMEFPMVIFPPTYLYAGAVVAAAGVLSALIVRHRIDHLDLVGVLKTRE